MKQAHEPGKRIVSKGEYAAKLGKRVALSSFGVGVVLAGLLLTLLAFRVVLEVSSDMTGALGLGLKAHCDTLAGAALLIGSVSVYLLYAGKRAVKDAQQIDARQRRNCADDGQAV